MSIHVHTDNWEPYLELEDNFERTSTAATIILLGEIRDLLSHLHQHLEEQFSNFHIPPSMLAKKNQ